MFLFVVLMFLFRGAIIRMRKVYESTVPPKVLYMRKNHSGRGESLVCVRQSRAKYKPAQVQLLIDVPNLSNSLSGGKLAVTAKLALSVA